MSISLGAFFGFVGIVLMFIGPVANYATGQMQTAVQQALRGDSVSDNLSKKGWSPGAAPKFGWWEELAVPADVRDTFSTFMKHAVPNT
ncbi:hypothetical protein HGQ17_09615 [Nesterenkonia sp. MY13]|uniref:Uncharacterized protein n=1 Tax=Nesterenkonia sedimenti TaxID=1463632 RepID=A0A7X8TLJ8_9MICC|nr:hypothetical protein [Nesterenkonia sedimenti]NLS10243.1 hypothetical protein [Nesterenkonia sedimenti]